MTPDSCRGAERNMFLRPPLLTSGSRTLREAGATGGVESRVLILCVFRGFREKLFVSFLIYGYILCAMRLLTGCKILFGSR